MIDLLTTVEYGGCSAKLSAKELDKLLASFPLFNDPNILVDNSLHDDAGVYKISDDLALIFTTDFFPPICSDPFTFGKIAAANSLSDVYAMGGVPFMALNINMYPSTLPVEGLAEIIRGGNEIALEAGVAILGGHTIDDAVPKYGMAVVGRVNPNRIITNSGLKVGQKLILTKPLGTGAIQAAQRVGLASKEQIDEILVSMSTLNARSLNVLNEFSPTGGTDITGFGLGGHAFRMAKASNVSIEIYQDQLPYFSGVKLIYETGCIPGASFRNREFLGDEVDFSNSLSYEEKMLIFDAQTSGGLLFGIDENLAISAIELLKNGNLNGWIVGEVKSKSANVVYVK
ncbi:selenide, water dikinase SelD [uncultured Acetobacteroides sp.]|uniref:selenide, water dikinase SelD n=1 Tax=uncultured Acetobacteroides sp. TaxID=1760811 RepID=UPI0029F4CDE9|nr:selenide, water dikinase SelD [uncultured Acetobacteroides sp.]